MSAIIKACKVGNSLKNSGKECDTSLLAAAMFILVPPALKWTLEDLEDPIGWITPLLHAAPGQRVYPLFGEQAPITGITNNAENDVIITLDDGTNVYIRPGVYNRIFETISGGLCYAKTLNGLLRSGYRFVELDVQAQMLQRDNKDGTFSGLISTFMYAPSPILADLRNTPYKNRFQLSLNPAELINNGVIFTGAEAFMSLMGLIDVDLLPGTQTQTTTNIFIKVQTECAESDLVALVPVPLAHANNFIVTNKATGVVISITAAAVVGGELRLTGTFVSGQTYVVKGTLPSVWLGNSLTGYDGSNDTAEVIIP